MSRLCGEQQRALQDAFGTRQLADRIEQLANKQIINKDIVAHGLDRSVPAPTTKPFVSSSASVWEAEAFRSDL